ncbi:MAG: dTDP-4-dehydrorhamnose reductase [Armatimonadota bacterium]
MKVAIIGANGQLGTDLCRTARDHDVVALTHSHVCVEDMDSVLTALRDTKPQIVINTAAFHRVDECETNPEPAFLVNAIGARNVAVACRDTDAVLVHISTDYVFGFDRGRFTPYLEEDPPAPVNVYGASKLAGEHLIRAYLERHYIIRTAALYGTAGASGKGGNFVETMLRLAAEGRSIRVVDDQITSPTYTRDLAAKIWQVIEDGPYGTYHITNSGQCSWFRFAQTIFRLSGLSPDLSPTTAVEFGAPAPRPSYSVLAHGSLRRVGLGEMRPWDVALSDYLSERSGTRR